jgi:adenine phosphoribosyltransferase
MLELLKKSLSEASVVKKGNYSYFQHPLTDGAPRIEPELLKEICSAIIKIADTDVDLILTMEAMGIHIASVLSQMTGIPMNIIRKTPRYLPNEFVLDQQTGYGKGKMYLNSIKNRDKILIVDAVISTGGTILATLKALNKIGAEVKDIVCAIERGDGKKRVKRETGFEVKTLVKIEVDDKVKILGDYFLNRE